jgi:glycosyltransferase involved in cell wall biosynthesis
MRIFFITHTYSLDGSGGGEQFVSNFLKQMRKNGHEIFVFTAGGKQFLQKEKKLGIEVYHCPVFGHHAFHKFEYALLSWKAVSLARSFKPDVIHAQNDAFPGLIGHFVKRATGKPLVLAVEYLSQQAVSLNLKAVFAINKFLLPKINFDAVVSWSDFVVEKFFLPWGIPKKKTHIIPGAVDVEKFSKRVSLHPKLAAKGRKWIVSAKPLHSTNAAGISYIVRAMVSVVKKHPDWKYAIIGNGQSKPVLQSLVKELKLEKNVFFFGEIPSEKIPSVYAAADIVAHSFAFKATTSIALMESMAAGKAIVATASGEVAPTVGDTALLPRQKDAKSIASSLNKLIENPALRAELGKKAQLRAKNLYSIESIASQFEEIYKSVQK